MTAANRRRASRTPPPALASAFDQVLAIGANRLCVIDHEDPRFCLKYERPLHERTRVGLRQALRRRLGQWWPALGDNRSEWRAYRRLRARLGSRIDGVFAACHGIIATAHGPALRCECVRDADGRPAPSLYRCLFGPSDRERLGEAFGDEIRDAREIAHRYDADALCAAVDRMEAWLLEHRVPLFDLNSGNFAVVADQHAAEDGTAVVPRLVCVDAKSLVAGKDLLPISRWVPALMRRKLRRRAERLRRRIRDAHADRAGVAGA